MKNRTDYQKLYDLIAEKDNFLLTSHFDPDGDSIGSLLGLNNYLKSIGKKTAIHNQGRLPAKYKFLDPDGIIHFQPEPLEFNPEVVFILDCPKTERIGFVNDYITDDMTIVNIDHHPGNKLFGDLNYVDETACSVAEIIYGIFNAGGYAATPEIAEKFYAAIASDTGRFKFSNTNEKCLKTASELVAAGANPRQISEKIFSSFSVGTIRLLGYMLENIELYNNGTICILKLTSDDLSRYNVQVEDTEGIIDYSLVIAGVKVGILFKEYEHQTVKVGLRSQNGIDISQYARKKGGGGHPNAAGLTIIKSLDSAITEVVAEISEFLNG
ncbi:MAG: bifunctional oligoribonuclease/PAP phosphatase NrnA [candidate division Zixibacteria bacterium]|nr:bifunctional oligoribonuclease/PAP phosphatase NrnA [candidate division Zixibacteria bacterium]